MDEFGFLGLSVLSYTYAIFTLLVALGLIVFVHEYGHFKVARILGFSIETFSIGFGRKIFGFRDRHGTEWKIGWLPLGGYVKFQGDANAASLPDGDSARPVQAGDFQTMPVWKRALVVAAGPLANFVLAIVLFTAFVLISGAPLPGAKLGTVEPGYPAAQAGLKSGDVIVSIDGVRIDDFNDIVATVKTRPGQTVEVVYERNGAKIAVSLALAAKEESRGFLGTAKLGKLGVTPSTEGDNLAPVGVFRAVEYGVDETWRIITLTCRFIYQLFTGQESIKQLGGLGSMGYVTSQAATHSFSAFLQTIAFLSVSIGLVNLFPIPILDGGHLVFYALEAVRRKPLGPAAQEWALKVGFALVLALMFIGNWNDVLRKIGQTMGTE